MRPAPKTSGTEPFDPLARYVDPETGYEYENFGSKFAGEEPPESRRNNCIAFAYKQNYPRHAIRAYWQAYDAHPAVPDSDRGDFGDEDLQKHNAGIQAGQATGCWGPVRFDGIDDTLDALRYSLYGAAKFDPKSIVKISF